MRNQLILLLSLLIFLGFIYLLDHTRLVSPQPVPAVSGTPSPPPVLGQQTRSSGCVSQGGLPDKACTPGAVFSAATKDQVCTPGYTRTVRNVPTQVKDEVYAEYDIFSHSPGQYEVDHFIPLELGGSNDVSNLWPEAADPTPGFHEKDTVENYLNNQVCSGVITLQQAQQVISSNWLQVYEQISAR